MRHAQRLPIRFIAPFLTSVAAACSGGAKEAPTQPHEPTSALLVTFDTTRADVFGCYGGPARVSPNVDRLAAGGIVFDTAYTTAPLTLPAHSSMLTGLYPLRHGLRDNGLAVLPGSAATLAERARDAGLETAAFVSAVVLDERFGLDQGFDTYTSPLHNAEAARNTHSEVRGSITVDRALEWLDQRDTARRFFLWVHFFDPHAPYDPPPVFSSRFPTRPYWGEVAAADAELGRLLDKLQEQGVLDKTTIIVTADHGEGFGEHDELTHGSFCYEATMRVPLILRHADAFEAGRRSESIVSVVDIYPTLADAMGFAAETDGFPLDGRSLFRREIAPSRGVYLESYDGYLSFGWSPLAGWVDADGKYLHSSEPQYFDLKNDKRESKNALPELGDGRIRYINQIEFLLSLPALAMTDVDIDPELLRGLQDLGYAGTGAIDEELPSPLADSDRPSPQSRVFEQRDTIQGLRLHRAGHDAEAEPLLRSVLELNPANYLALDGLARCLFAQGRYQESVAAYERLLRDGPQWNEAWFHLGLALDGDGRSAEALVPIKRALDAEPRNSGFWSAYREVAEHAKDHEAQALAEARLQELERE